MSEMRATLIEKLAPQFRGLVHNEDDGTWIVEHVVDAIVASNEYVLLRRMQARDLETQPGVLWTDIGRIVDFEKLRASDREVHVEVTGEPEAETEK